MRLQRGDGGVRELRQDRPQLGEPVRGHALGTQHVRHAHDLRGEGPDRHGRGGAPDALRRLQNRDQVEGSRGVKLEKGAGELVTAE